MPKSKYQYLTNCVSSAAKDIIEMADQARQISYNTFRRYVNMNEVNELLGYPIGNIRLSNDWCVSFHRSKFRGRPCVYVCWSAIEYIFCPE